MSSRKIIVSAALALTFTGYTALAIADQLRFMDDAGNIRFVDKLAQVPPQYRNQIVTPTPAPVYTEKEVRDMKRKQAEEQREQEKKKKDREDAIKKREAELHRERSKDAEEAFKADASKDLDRVK